MSQEPEDMDTTGDIADTGNAVYDAVFGRDSDSDLSDDDDNEQVQPPQKKKPQREYRSETPERADRSPTPSSGHSRSPTPVSEPESDAYDEDHGARTKSKIPKFKKKQRSEGEDDEAGQEGAGEGGSKKRKRAPTKTRSSKREERGRQAEVQGSDDDEPRREESPETARRRALDAKFSQILKNPNKSVSRRAKKGEEDDLDRIADEEVKELRDRMMRAADYDVKAIEELRPADAKLKMLPLVMALMQQGHMNQAIIDNNFLEAVTYWLEPLPNKELPALDIINSFVDILLKMDIDTEALKQSRLGRIILFYTKTKRATTHVKRQADKLIAQWQRPITKRSASYRTKFVSKVGTGEVADEGAGEEVDDAPIVEKRNLKAILKEGSQGDAPKTGPGSKQNSNRGLRIPQPDFRTFNVAPNSQETRESASAQRDQERRQRDAERLRKVKSTLLASRAAERL